MNAPAENDAPKPAPRRVRAGGVLVLLGCVVFGTAVRVHNALGDPHFDAENADGMLRSDPALLYYLVERLLEGGGLPPEDFRADPRVQYPDTADLPAMFTICQEYLVAWCYLWFGGGVPLHVFCVWLMAILASLAAVGVYGLTLELTRKPAWASLAAVLYCLLPSNYRTIGFILIREDFSLPCLALHLYLLARALRVRTGLSVFLAALALVLALSSWHAMSFLVTMEVACVLAWTLRTGENPLAARKAWLFPATLAVACLVVPVLQSKLFLLSLPMQMLAALLVLYWVGRQRTLSGWSRLGLAVAVVVTLSAAAFGLSRSMGGGQGDYAHVFEFILAKVTLLGRFPEDPASLPFGVRILWQGPFDTNNLTHMLSSLLLGGLGILVAVPFAIRGWLRGQPDGRILVLQAFAILSLGVAYLIQRTEIVPGLLGPVVLVVLLGQLPWRTSAGRSLVLALVVAVLLVQGLRFHQFATRMIITWYLPPGRQTELSGLVQWLREPACPVPADAAIAADFVYSTSLLAHLGNPILLQPKYETRESRDRAEGFYTTCLRGSLDDVRAWMKRYECRYLLIDRRSLWASRALAGIPESQSEPARSAAIRAFYHTDQNVLENLPGYRLLYRSPPGSPHDLFRLFEVELP